MSHFSVVVVTDAPDDVDATLAPFDENLEVEPYREVEGKVADKAARAREFLLDFPQYVPDSIMQKYFWDVPEWDLTGPSLSRPNLRVDITPGDETAKPWEDAAKAKHSWANREDARRWLADIPDEPLILAHMADDGYANLRIEGDEVVYDSTSNPQSKWDWWVIGGRWRGYFYVKPSPVVTARPMNESLGSLSYDIKQRPAALGKPGVPEMIATRDGGPAEDYRGRADQLQWRDVDFDAMREAARVKAEEEYDEFEAAVGDIPAPSETFPAMRDRIMGSLGIPSNWDAYLASTAAQRDSGGDSWRKAWDDAMTEVRAQWGGHPWIRALREARLDPFGDDPMEFYRVGSGGRESYVAHWVAQAGVPYALVVKGEWIAKGRMGWFGMSADTATQDEWNAAVQAFYAQLPPDAWVTAVDCHI